MLRKLGLTTSEKSPNVMNIIQPTTRSNRSTPNVVLAPHPEDRVKYVELSAHPDIIRKFMDLSLNAKIGEYCGLVHGNVEEANPTCDMQGTNGLLDSFALFKGLKRPFKDTGHDGEIYIYITNPKHTYIYPEKDRYSVVGPTRLSQPIDSVFATYVSFKEDKTSGIILDWEWVLADKRCNTLPAFYDVRYDERIW